MTAVYLDANALIRFVETEDELFDVLLDAARLREGRLCTSEFTLAEVLVMPLRNNDDAMRTIYEALFASESEVEIIPVDRAVLCRSAKLRAFAGGKAPDAIHVATAILAGCSIFVSSDQRIVLPHDMRRVDADAVAHEGIWD